MKNKSYFIVYGEMWPSFCTMLHLFCTMLHLLSQTTLSHHCDFVYWLDTIFSLRCLPRILSWHNSFNQHHWQGQLWTHLSGEWDGRHQKLRFQELFTERKLDTLKNFLYKCFEDKSMLHLNGDKAFFTLKYQNTTSVYIYFHVSLLGRKIDLMNQKYGQ